MKLVCHPKISIQNDLPEDTLWQSKIKYKEFKKQQGKKMSYKGTPQAISRVFSRNLAGQKRVGWYIQNDERKNCQPRMLYLSKLPFRNESKIKTFPDKQRWECSLPLDLHYKKCWSYNERMLINNMKICSTLLKGKYKSNSEYSNTVIWWCVNHLSPA